jgi:hypothetical protein
MIVMEHPLASAPTCVAAPIADFISSEMVDLIQTVRGLSVIAAVRYRASITAVDIEMVIYMAAKVPGAVKPRASTDEDTPGEPFRTVVAVGSTGVRSEVVIAVRACGFGTDGDVDLGLRFGSGRRKANYSDSSSSESTSESVHESSSGSSELRGSQCTSAELRIDSRKRNSSYG